MYKYTIYQWIYKLLYTNKAKLLVFLQDIQQQFNEEWKGVQQSSQQMSQYRVLALIVSYLAYLEVFDINIVDFNELYIPYYIPLFCIMCHVVKNE
jgi:hypothetical protein